MLNQQKKSVGLLLIVKTNSHCELLLHRRGDWNSEKKDQESWPGLLQETVHGGVEPEEDEKNALAREIQEELHLSQDLANDLVSQSSVLAETIKRKRIILHALVVDQAWVDSNITAEVKQNLFKISLNDIGQLSPLSQIYSSPDIVKEKKYEPLPKDSTYLFDDTLMVIKNLPSNINKIPHLK